MCIIDSETYTLFGDEGLGGGAGGGCDDDGGGDGDGGVGDRDSCRENFKTADGESMECH